MNEEFPEASNNQESQNTENSQQQSKMQMLW